MNDWGWWIFEFAVGIAFIFGTMAFTKWDRARSDRAVRESLGAVKGVDVGIVLDEGRDLVGLTFEGSEDYTRVLMSAQQARLLAESLRIAGTKGRTLLLAKVNYRRAKAAT